MGLSAAEIIALGVGSIAGADFLWRTSGSILKRVRGDAGRSAATDIELAQAMRDIARVANEMERSNDQFRQHEKECAEFRGETVATLKALNTNLEKVERGQNQLQSQIRMVVTGAANRAIEIPPDMT